jgi:hypothetical protein
MGTCGTDAQASTRSLDDNRNCGIVGESAEGSMGDLNHSVGNSENDRRSFLKSCGRFAATVPPTMTVMLATSLTSNAIAKSTGTRDTGSKGGGDGVKKKAGN